MTDSAEEFLATRTGECARLHLRLTPEACQGIRNRPGGSHPVSGGDGPPPQCAGCPGVRIGESVASPDPALPAPIVPKPQEEAVPQQAAPQMPTAPGIYTIRDIARLAGVSVKTVYNAKYASGEIWPGTARALVRDTLQSLGIGFSDLKKGTGGPRPKKKTGAAPCSKNEASALPETQDTLNLPEPGGNSLPESDFAAIREAMAASAQVSPEVAPIERMRSLPLNTYGLEDLVHEIKRRFPMAEVVLR